MNGYGEFNWEYGFDEWGWRLAGFWASSSTILWWWCLRIIGTIGWEMIQMRILAGGDCGGDITLIYTIHWLLKPLMMAVSLLVVG